MIQVPKITNKDELQKKILSASTVLYKVAKAAYGPKAGNVLLGFKHGPPMLSRDGVTNLKQVRSTDPQEDDVIQAIKAISEKNNQKVGDGTTAVIILAHHLLLAAQKLEGKNFNPMEIAAKLHEAEKIALAYINKIKKPVKNNSFLDQIATVSAGDTALGQMIADIMREVGKDGGVLIEQHEGLGVHNELIDGFYFARGYKDTELINDPVSNQSNHQDIPILISSKSMDTEVDIAPILNSLVQKKIKQFILIGEVNNNALETLKMSRAKGVILGVPVDPPYTVGGRTLFLDDIALMVGAKVYNGLDFDPEEHLGFAKEVLVTGDSTTVLGGDAEKKQVKERVISLQKQLKETDHPQDIKFIKDRLARLTGKMAIIKVGGAIEMEREETKLRVQDAVCAVQSALKGGVLPGGGVTLAKVTGTDFDDAFKQPFLQLVENAGLNPFEYLALLKDSDQWDGFNLRRLTPKPVNMLEEGVLDAAPVIEEVVRNAVSVVAGLITASVGLAYDEKE